MDVRYVALWLLCRLPPYLALGAAENDDAAQLEESFLTHPRRVSYRALVILKQNELT